MDMGSARLGIMVADKLRRNRKMTSTTRMMARNRLNCDPRRVAGLRSPAPAEVREHWNRRVRNDLCHRDVGLGFDPAICRLTTEVWGLRGFLRRSHTTDGFCPAQLRRRK